tara:strand:+ start:4547 stop:5431 length:885 start_codon:yes stop_codon:yes gene_type:complete
MKNKSILNIQISAFSSYLATEPKEVNLLVWLNSKKYFTQVEKIRNTKDEKIKKHLKSKLPAITPSGLFSKRNAKGLLKHSGFIQFDIDFKDNIHIYNYEDLKEQIREIKEVAYCGLSVSGNGYWGLIPISNPTKHKQHFEALLLSFKNLGINIDKSCKDVSRLRGYSFDDNAYFNHSATKFKQIYNTPIKKYNSKNYITNNFASTNNSVEKHLNIIKEKQVILATDYESWFAIGCGIANEFGENGRNYFHFISQIKNDYNSSETDKQYNHCLKNTYNYSIATFFYYCKLNNIHI